MSDTSYNNEDEIMRRRQEQRRRKKQEERIKKQKRNRIIILPVTDTAVALYLSLFLDEVFIRCGGKFDHLIEFIVLVCADSAAFLFLKWLCVEAI